MTMDVLEVSSVLRGAILGRLPLMGSGQVKAEREVSSHSHGNNGCCG
jgi:hypothetical protein